MSEQSIADELATDDWQKIRTVGLWSLWRRGKALCAAAIKVRTQRQSG
ncbi:MAG: hypothetical protein ACOYLQ_08000 [Hyphomicrobiaceae bacterium]